MKRRPSSSGGAGATDAPAPRRASTGNQRPRIEDSRASLAVVQRQMLTLPLRRSKRIEAADVEVPGGTVLMGALVRAVAAEYSVGEGVPRVHVHAPAEAVLVCGDRARPARVLHNLIGYAVKYSPRGTPIDAAPGSQPRVPAVPSLRSP